MVAPFYQFHLPSSDSSYYQVVVFLVSVLVLSILFLYWNREYFFSQVRRRLRPWGFFPRKRFPKLVVEQIWKKTQGKCHLCHTQLSQFHPRRGIWEVDHVYPWSLGGSDHLNNLLPACQSCNASKSNRASEGEAIKRKKRKKRGFCCF